MSSEPNRMLDWLQSMAESQWEGRYTLGVNDREAIWWAIHVIDSLKSENRELRKDKARLDKVNGPAFRHIAELYESVLHIGINLRDAIDTLDTEDQPANG